MFEQHVYAIVLQMATGNTLRLMPNLGQSVHAAFLNIIRSLDVSLAQQLHDKNQHKLYTVSPLWADQPIVKAGQDVYTRFTFLDPNLASLFVEQFLLYGHHHTMTINGIHLPITDIYATPQGHPRAGKLPLHLSEQAPLFKDIELNFITPTAFSRKNGKHVEYLTDMAPKLVWKYARRMWGYSGGKDPGQTFDNWVENYCTIQHSSLKHDKISFKRFFITGVYGKVVYSLRNDTPKDEYHQLWCNLSRFMAFSGIGYKTTMGMGQVLPIIRDEET